MHDDPLDCLIVGAGPAGLTAATYLIRFHRRIAVVDAGQSRARWIPTSHNCPGFPAGIAGSSLLERLREHACSYGTTITTGRITALERDGEVFLATAQDGRQWRARHVLLATGIVDRMPQMEVWSMRSTSARFACAPSAMATRPATNGSRSSRRRTKRSATACSCEPSRAA